MKSDKHDTVQPSEDVAATGFATLGLDSALLSTLETLGYEEPTGIQREAIPPLLEGKDLLGQAGAGTGKTAAFALPMLQLLARGERRQPSALILVPTRELAIQVAEAIKRYGQAMKLGVVAIYGGQSIAPQLQSLRRGVEIVVATPGRALDHIRRKTLKLQNLQIVILDEADEMLDMGFTEELEAVLAETPATRQTALFSATMPTRITAIARHHLKNPVEIRIAREVHHAGAAPRVRQTVYLLPKQHKTAALVRILDIEQPASALVFCRTRVEVDELTGLMQEQGLKAETLHGGMTQAERDRAMKGFRSGKTRLLVATDVAARGIDIPHVSHVINYDLPSSGEVYIHRIGRTGRAGREGVAITILEPREKRHLRSIEQLTRTKIEVGTVPTVTQLQTRRLERTGTAIREILQGDGLEQFVAMVKSLAENQDPLTVAAAAVKLAFQAKGHDRKEVDIPILQIRDDERAGRGRRDRHGQSGRHGPETARNQRGHQGKEEQHRKKRTHERKEEGRDRTQAGRTERPEAQPGRHRASAIRCKLYIAGGLSSGTRPGDLVGAIVNEAKVDAVNIGAIEMTDRYALVEIPEHLAPHIINALSRTKIRGRKVSSSVYRK